VPLIYNASSCEFLSIWYIYQSNYNEVKTDLDVESVVSSFQFGIFIKVITTSELDELYKILL